MSAYRPGMNELAILAAAGMLAAAWLSTNACRGTGPDAPAPTHEETPLKDTTPGSLPADAPLPAASEAAPVEGTPVPFAQEWRGRILVPFSTPGEPLAAMPPRVITDEAGYSAFVDRIPTESIQMKQPAPPSDDPLLARPPLDFTKHALLVAFRTDSMYVGPLLSNARLVDGTLLVDLEHPPLGESAYAAARMDVGTYHAALVEKPSGQVEFREK